MATCPGCSAENPENVNFCEYCGVPLGQNQASSPLAQTPQPAAAAKGPAQKGFGTKVSTFKCDSCGAVVHYSAGEKALHCAYCGSNYVVEVEAEDKVRPSRIVPFAVEKEKSSKLFREWLGKGFWRPGDLKSRAKANELLGVYLPFWAFDAKADSRWSASAGYNYRETEQYTDSKGQNQTRTVTKVRWRPASGEHTFAYIDWLVSASGGLHQEWVAQIVPFHLDQAKPYSPDYMAGWAAEDYSIENEQAQTLAKDDLNIQEERKCAEMVPGDTHKDLRVSSTFTDWVSELVVLPIYISSYTYRDKVYRFLINGQTGEVVGKAPVSKLKIAVAILLGLGIVGGIAAAVALTR